jgi:hypothetical protein
MKKLLISLILLPVTTLSLQSSLTITNASFENFSDDTTSAGDTNHDLIDSWFEESHGTYADSTGDETAEQALIEGGNRPLTTAGTHWGHITDKDDSNFGDPAIYQNLGTWNTGDATSYDFSMLLGDRDNQSFMSLTVEFFSVDSADGGSGANGTTFANAFSTESLLDTDSTPTINGGVGTLTQLYSNTFNFNLASLNDSDSIWLRISGVNSQTNGTAGQRHSLIDDLSITAVPEPSTYAIFAGLLALGLVMLRRRLR